MAARKVTPASKETAVDDSRVTLNIGGQRFTVTKETLENVPGTRLSRLTISSPSYDKGKGEHYFDRDPKAFSCILNFYRTSELHLPNNLCGNAIRRELEFWELNESLVSECCWKLLHESDQGKAINDVLNKKLKDDHPAPDMRTSSLKYRMHSVWLVLDKPNSSKAAKIWSYVFILVILASSIAYCLETVPDLRVNREAKNYAIGDNLRERLVADQDNVKLKMIILTEPHPGLYYFDIGCLCIFSLELLLHFVTYPCKCRFFKRFLNWIDIITVSMGWVVFALEKVFASGQMVLTLEVYITYLTLKSLYILRLFRFFRLAQSFTGLKVLLLAVKASLPELSLLIFCIIVVATMFGSFEYFCEFNNNRFDNIPISIWWALVTMTTLGYGDYYPSSTYGRVLGACCALSGLLILAMPIAVIAKNFNDYYSQNQSRESKRKKEGWGQNMQKIYPLVKTAVKKF